MARSPQYSSAFREFLAAGHVGPPGLRGLTMFEYRFVSCPVHFKGSKIDVQDYRKAIEGHAAEGWRLVQVLVPMPAAIPSEYELIFERPRPQ